MTMIVGAVGPDGLAYLMGDRCTSDGNGNRAALARPKLVRLGDVMIGTAGTSRAQSLIQHRVDITSQEWPAEEGLLSYVERVLADAIRCAFDSGGYSMRGDKGESQSNAEIVLAGRGQVVSLHQSWQATETARRWECVGSAYENADGAMAVVARDSDRGFHGILADVGVAVCGLRTDSSLPLDIWREDGASWLITQAGGHVACVAGAPR